MTSGYVITGTDTDIGKTIFAAALTQALGAKYWKPVQAGLDDRTDSGRVQQLGGASQADILPEIYRLKIPASPHYSAEQEGIEIDPAKLSIPEIDGPLVIEGAGGALVPLNRKTLNADLFAQWQLPTIIVARTGLGTINHSLMTIEVLRARKVPLLGIAFVGDEVKDSQDTVCEIGRVKSLGRLPILESLTPETIAAAFAQNFRLEDFV